VNVSQLTKAFGARTVLDNLAFRVDPGDRLAVVGRNGEGKTTLLRILAGEIPADAGAVSMPRGARVALHDQRPPLHRDITLGLYVAEGVADAQAAEDELAALEARMATGDAGPEVMAAYERATARLEAAGGYAWRAWLGRVTRGLKIPDARLDDPLSSFSGGELTRASLARALVSRPDVLLLDEPTNHLDVTSAEWLEEAVSELGAAVVVVSHDRWFLESVATGILEIERGRGKVWPMGYSAYRTARAVALEQQVAESERQRAEIARLERFVERWKAGTKSKQASSRQKRLDKIDRIDVPRRRDSLAFGFPPAGRSGRVVMEVDDLDVRVGDRTLVSGAGFALERGQRLAVVGPNGTGKTTLVETLIGLRKPSGGRVSVGHRVELAYFSQHETDLRGDRTVVETILSESSLTRTQARTILGSFLFGADMADRRVDALSGGERRRLSLVALVAGGGNLLVLDEPTNHLDTESREALEDAIQAYDGTVVLISHDRALIDAVATSTLAIEDQKVVLRPGGWLDLLRSRAEAAAAPPKPTPAPKAAKKTALPQAEPTAPRSSGRAARDMKRLEKRVAELETQVANVEIELIDPDVLTDRARLAEAGQRHEQLQKDLSWALHEWESAAEAAGVA
jgi:ATP-binding cassette, subfamily F, member 3